MSETQVSTADQLIQVLQASHLLTTGQMAKARQFADTTPDPIALARRLINKGLITRWQARQLLVGRHSLTLGKYQLRDEIGKSETGRVFLAEHVQMHRQVAIKTLSRRFTRNPEYAERFLDEARKAATLDHRNILHIYDIDRQRDRFFLVLEHVTGWDLRRLVDEKGPRPFGATADYIRQAAEGIRYIHRFEIAHRNLNPRNLMVDEQGVVKILALGTRHLTEAADVDQRSPSSSDPVESAEYRAPEQLLGTTDVDGRADLFSLGCIGYYLLTGQPPFSGSTLPPTSLPSSSSSNAPIPPSITELRPEVPTELAAIIEKMMARDLESRYQTAAEVVHALRQWIGQQHSTKQPDYAAQSDVTQPAGEAAALAPAGPPRNQPAGDGQAFTWTPGEPAPAEREGPTPGEHSQPHAPSAEKRISRKRLAAAAALALAVIATAACGIWVWKVQSQQPSIQTTQRTTVQPKPRDTLAPSPLENDAHRAPLLPSSQASAAPSPGEPSPEPEDAPASAAGPDSIAAEKGSVQDDKSKKSPPDASPANPTSPDAADEADNKNDKAKKEAEPSATDPNEPDEPPPLILALLPDAFDLPPPPVDEPASTVLLGALRPRPSIPVTMTLLGGTSAIDGDVEFHLAPDTKKGPDHWKIFLHRREGDDEQRRSIAHLSTRAQQLTYLWDENAPTELRAMNVTNCVLRLSAGDETHDLRLRIPEKVDPLRVQLKRPTFDGKWQLQHPPTTASIRWHITSLEEPFPPDFELIPPTPSKVREGQVLLKCGLESEKQVLLFEIETTMKRLLRVTGKVVYQLPTMDKPELLTRKNFLATERQVVTNQLAKNAQVQAVREQVQRFGRQDPRRAPLERQLVAVEKVLGEATRVTEAMDELRQLSESLGNGAAIHFRPFFLAGDCEVDLLTSGEALDEATTEAPEN